MNDQSWFQQAADWVASGLGALVLALSAYINNRFKTHGKRLGRLERESVSHEDLDITITKMSMERTRMHEENQETLASIKNDTASTHRRIDELYRDLLNRAK